MSRRFSDDPKPKPHNLGWSAQTETPDDLSVGVIRFTALAAAEGGGILQREADRYPDVTTERTLKAPLGEINQSLRSALMFIGLELFALQPLSITTETVSSPDSDFHLLISNEETGVYVITLQVPELPPAVCAEFRVDSGFIQVRCDGDDWQNLIDLDDLKGEQGEQGEQGVPGEVGATGETGAQGEQGEPGEDCSGCGTQPGEIPTDTDTIPPGDCRSYDLVLDTASQVVIPVLMQPGYTVSITGVTGTASDGAYNIVGVIDASPYYCPDGSQSMPLEECDPEGVFVHLDEDDPMPEENHMTMIMNMNGELYNVGAGGFWTVPAGAEDTLVLIQVNDTILYDNFGTYQFHVDVCAPAPDELVFHQFTSDTGVDLGIAHYDLLGEGHYKMYIDHPDGAGGQDMYIMVAGASFGEFPDVPAWNYQILDTNFPYPPDGATYWDNTPTGHSGMPPTEGTGLILWYIAFSVEAGSGIWIEFTAQLQ